MVCRTSRNLSLASPRTTTLGSVSVPTAARRTSPKSSAATCLSLIQTWPASSIETSIRPLSSPWSLGFEVFGRLTSGPLRICGAITMKMISSTSTTSTSGVTLMAACILPGSPRRIRHLVLFDLRQFDSRYFEQAVHQLGRSPVHLNVGILNLAGEVVECDDGRDRDEDAQGCRDQRLSDTAGDHTHPTGSRGRDAAESVDDSDHGAEQA